jgi:hypothetical protein
MKLSVGLAALLLSVSAHAQGLASLGSELDSAVAELPGLNATMSATTDANIGLKKEYDVYIADQTQKKTALATAIANVERTVKAPLEQEVAGAVAEYNTRCGRQFNRETEMDQYNRCVSDKANLDVWRTAKIAWWEQFTKDWNKVNVDPVNAVILKQNARIAQIDAEMKRNFAAFTDAQDRSLALRARIKAIEAEFVTACAKPSTPETTKWCHSVNWDGASRKLVPLYKWQGTGGAAPN